MRPSSHNLQVSSLLYLDSSGGLATSCALLNPYTTLGPFCRSRLVVGMGLLRPYLAYKTTRAQQELVAGRCHRSTIEIACLEPPRTPRECHQEIPSTRITPAMLQALPLRADKKMICHQSEVRCSNNLR